MIIKGAPLLAVSDSLPMTNWVDGVLITTRKGVTRLKALQNMREMLSQTDARVVGVVVNGVPALSEAFGDFAAYGQSPNES